MTEQPTTEQLIERLARNAGGETGVNLSTLTEREAAKRLREQADELDRLRADAERYRWLRDQMFVHQHGGFCVIGLSGYMTCAAIRDEDFCVTVDRLVDSERSLIFGTEPKP